ncbi:hypothetical protein AMELA_G00001750 [Ameiurus melas]|uniref:Uncharacterized protein n=1 Tax=Ameiurus melas TaxID=219545 RepID=A0A7J6BI13_AMEME|nr:hypothetical protein AMELA_G00001750 [Ameiurus melas]
MLYTTTLSLYRQYISCRFCSSEHDALREPRHHFENLRPRGKFVGDCQGCRPVLMDFHARQPDRHHCCVHIQENQTCKTEQCQNQTYQTGSTCEETSNFPILNISVIFNCVLVIVVTVFTVRHCRRRPKTQAQPLGPVLQPRQDGTGPVYAEVQFSRTNEPVRTANRPIRTSNLDSTYALVKL